jgi:hypothetical protein
MPMGKISLEEARKIADRKGLKPGLVKGTEGVQFTRGENGRIEPVSWEEFENHLRARRLAVYESGGYMKVMRA